ncbi:MAG: hypothetical protein HPAVJP_1070 [Candidatus Hepatoplasma vulgare]|nr:MAG: hypothetical protein HPAVJP_1070 [Candidatus Hepatoplasma sp.]
MAQVLEKNIEKEYEKELKNFPKDDFLMKGKDKNKSNSSSPSPNKKKKNQKNLISEKEQEIKKSKKKKWIIIVLIVIFVLALGLGLGLGLGLKDSEENSSGFPGPDNIDTDMKEVETLKQQAAGWAYNQLYYTYGLIDESDYNKKIDKVEKDVDNQIDNEKESYRDQYGDNWEEEWDKYLTEQGYDDEEEYKDALISESLKNETDDIIINNLLRQIIIEDDSSDVTYHYKSTIPDADSTNAYWVIDNGETPLGDGNVHSVNGEALYEGYINLTNPISYYDLLIPFTMNGLNSYNGLYGNRIVFDSDGTTTNLKTAWDIAADYYLSWYQTSLDGGGTIEKNFGNYDNASIVQTSLNETSDNKFTAIPLFEMFISDVNTNFDWSSISESMSYEDVAENFYLLNDIIGKTSFLTATDVNNGREVWPGYTYNSGTDNSVPLESSDKADSISGVKSGKGTGTEQDYFDALLPGQIDLVGLQLMRSLQETNLFKNPDDTSNRYIYSQVPFNYNSYFYSIDENGELVGQSDFSDTTTTLEENVYLVLDSTGLHILAPTIYYDDSIASNLETGSNQYNYGDLMLIGDLDRLALDGTKEDKPPSSNVRSNFTTWFTSVSDLIYLNSALNDQNFLDDYLKDVNKDGNIDDLDLDIIVQNFYNDFFNKQYNKFLNKCDSAISFLKEYLGLYDLAGYSFLTNISFIKDSLVFLQHSNQYQLTSTIDILETGNLSGGEI